MTPLSISAITFTILTSIIILFQVCLAGGLPWDAAYMGGKYPGQYPTKMHFVAIANAILLAIFVIIVLIRAELILPQLFSISRIAIWLVVAFSYITTILNIITPSKIERIWAPVALILAISSTVVALS